MTNNIQELSKKYIEYIKSLPEAYDGDQEQIHIYCDDLVLDLLTELGLKDVVEEVKKLEDKIGFWYS